MIIPFIEETFSQTLKRLVSGVNMGLEYDNIQSALYASGIKISELIGKEKYNDIASGITEEDPEAGGALDILQRAMLHMSLHSHLIFLVTRIGNDGITIKEGDGEKTLYKYQADELKESLIKDYWLWLNQLIELVEMPSNLPDCISSSDFKKFLGIDSSYFIAKITPIVNEEFEDNFKCRFSDAFLTTEDNKANIARALVYRSLYLAILRLPYEDLPDTIRRDIRNEYTIKNPPSEKEVRNSLSDIYNKKALRYLTSLDLAYSSFKSSGVGRKFIKIGSDINENDKFCSTC